MKKLLLSSTFLVVGSVTCMAADLRLPVKAAPLAVAPAFNWTGCYVGAHVGGANTRTLMATNFEGSGSTGDNGTGAVAGGQIGCNYQAGNWVFGVEGEGAWSSSKATNFLAFPNTDSISLTTKNTNDFSIAGRAGVAFDRTLIYGKGGWVWGSFDYNPTVICCGGFPVALPAVTPGNYSANGFLVGAGIEHALTRNWTVKLEYNYLDFGSKFLNFGLTPGFTPLNVDVSKTKQIFKIGANYLFDVGGAPVVAKY